MSTPWPTTTIGELFDIGAGKSVTPASRGQDPKRPFLRTSNVLWGRFDLTDVDTMFFTDDEFAVKNLRSGDLLVCEGGDIGRAAVWQGQLAECSFQNHLHRLRPKRPDISPEFYQFALEGGITLFGLIEGVGNRTTIPNLSRNRLAELAVPKPPIDEQRKIAAVLGKVQAAVAVEGDLVRVARELKQAALRQLFTRGLLHEPQKQTTLGPVPQSWVVEPLSQAAFLQRGRFTHRPRNEPRFYGGKTPFVQTGDVVRSDGWVREHTQTLTDEGVAISRVFPAGTILITIAANIGYSGVLTYACAAPDSLVGITASEDFDTTYLSYYLQTQQKRMDELAARGTQKNINIQFLTPWPVPKPPIAEQREIAALLATLDAKIAHHEARRALLRELFRTLLHDLLTARRRVTSLD